MTADASTANQGELQPESSTLLTTALAWYAAGFSVIRVNSDGTKKPYGPWKSAQTEAADADTITRWFAEPRGVGLGVVMGTISGNAEMFELEGRAIDDGIGARFAELMHEHGLGELWTRLTQQGYVEISPSGGPHLIYRVEGGVGGNTALARRPAGTHVDVLLETRGEGGFVVVAPSSGTVHPTGKPWLLAPGATPGRVLTITARERNGLHAVATLLDEMPRRAARDDSPPFTQPTTGSADTDEGITPGTDYNTRSTWDDTLTPHGWTVAYRLADRTFWTRPGKNGGVSAVTGGDYGDYMYVWSTSTNLPAEEALSKWRVYTFLNCGGNFSAAARDLRAQGYGGRRPDKARAADPNNTREQVESRTDPTWRPSAPPLEQEQPEQEQPERPCPPMSLAASRETFRRWLGQDYDIDAHDAVLCALAAERLDGDPLWLLLISGSGNAKTETVQAAAATGAIVTSTITSEGALLSATPARDKGKHATGGLLRRLGARGVLVIKDVTSILAMNRDTRGAVLAAFREIHDGYWTRNVGTDGGRTLTWQGRIVVIGAVTTAWDRAHDVIAAMGDRFVLLRIDSTVGRANAGRQAISNTGSEDQMRADLAAAVAGVLAGIHTEADITLTTDETERLLAAADLVTLARTGVDYDYRGDVIDAHAPEMPTRFAKQIAQLVRGGIALGMGRDHAMRLAIRCARDSMPPLRLAILRDVAAHPYTTTHAVRVRTGKPRATVDRQLQSLHMLGLLTCTEAEGNAWRYQLSGGFDLAVLVAPELVPDLSPHGEWESGEESPPTHVPPTDKSGTTPGDPPGSPPGTPAAARAHPMHCHCGEPLLLHTPGRTECERCRIRAAS